MSRSRFRPLSGPGETAGQPVPRSPAHLPVLALSCTLEPDQATPVIAALLTRILAERRPPGTVILDLGTASDLDAAAGDGLHGLLDRLAGRGIRFRLASASAKVRAQFTDAGLASRLGRGGVLPGLRAAVLAVYADLPGPGLVTPEVRGALVIPAEPVGPAGPAAAPAAAPAGPARVPVTPVMLTRALAGPADQTISQRGLAPPEPA